MGYVENCVDHASDPKLDSSDRALRLFHVAAFISMTYRRPRLVPFLGSSPVLSASNQCPFVRPPNKRAALLAFHHHVPPIPHTLCPLPSTAAPGTDV